MAIHPALIGAISGGAAGGFEATGGIENEYSGYKSHTFLSTANFEVTAGTADIEILVVSGGGAGSGPNSGYVRWSSGGGAGGMRTFTASDITVGTYTVTIGAGGAGRENEYQTAYSGSPSDVVLDATYETVGGAKGRDGNTGGVGGSGSGGSCSTYGGGIVRAGGAGTADEGNAGGSGTTYYNSTFGHFWSGGGGGGGKGAVGSDGGFAYSVPYGTGGAGGVGATNDYRTGAGIYYAGGGGGSAEGRYGNVLTGPTVAGAGGNGGGGKGACLDSAGPPSANVSSDPGDANTGGGGGASGNIADGNNVGLGAGGSGIIVLRYAV